MNAEERLKAAGWTRLHQPCDLTMYRWTRDGIDWYTEDEALVVALTAERDAAIARAERSEAELGECKRWIGDVMEAMDNEFMSIQMAPVFIGAMAEMQKANVPEMQALRARAEAAEALAASRPEITPEDARDGAVDAHGPGAREAYMRNYDALRAHAAKVSR